MIGILMVLATKGFGCILQSFLIAYVGCLVMLFFDMVDDFLSEEE